MTTSTTLSRRRFRSRRPDAHMLAAGAAFVAATVHLWAATGHADAGWLHVLFFAAVGMAQLALALLLLRHPGTTVLLAGIWGTLVVVAVYVLSRTTGVLPGGHAESTRQLGHGAHGTHLPVPGGWGNGVPVIPPLATTVEPVGFPDLTALVVELTLVAMLVAMLPAVTRRGTTNVMLVLGVFLCSLRATRILA